MLFILQLETMFNRLLLVPLTCSREGYGQLLTGGLKWGAVFFIQVNGGVSFIKN